MTDESPVQSAEKETATEEETLAEKQARREKQNRRRGRRARKTVLIVVLSLAAAAAAGFGVWKYALPAWLGAQLEPGPAIVSELPAASQSAPAAPASAESSSQSAPAQSSVPRAANPNPQSSESSQIAESSQSSEPTQSAESSQSASSSQSAAGSAASSAPPLDTTPYLYAMECESTRKLDTQLYSTSAILIDLDTNLVIAEKNPDAKIYPASMTKILTALVASEHVENWDDDFTMTQAIIDPLYKAGASLAGFEAGETVTLRDLLYGALLPSGAEATAALAIYAAGSEEAFTELMNEKAQELGLTTAHFMNNSGLHDAEHCCTVRDMAVILRAALQNPACREALSSMHYTTTATEQHPEGLQLTDKFLYRVSKKDQKGSSILGAKTGYTAEAGNCCASYGQSPDGRNCLIVTANAQTSWLTIDDHIALYSTYADEQ
jgi:D-alanyl-D-alanine carboxypeptidase (penicillin-binding protein 5/6)